MADPSLESLLRNSSVTNGVINLLRIDGGPWRAVISHHAGGEFNHMIHPLEDWEKDPVDALRIALVEDERQCRDLRRRYASAPKMGDVIMEQRLQAQAGVDSDFDDYDAQDLLG